jgi:hypothetical protein
MAAVPLIINGVMMPKGKDARDKPVPAVFLGYASIAGLSVGGGPVLPVDGPPIDPPDPIDPPPENPPPNAVIVIKPAPVTGGWGVATDAGGQFQWFFVPSESGAGPKHR